MTNQSELERMLIKLCWVTAPSNQDDVDKVLAYITADRKRVALEARVAELEKFVNTTNRSLSVKKLRDRLSELKSQQEEL